MGLSGAYATEQKDLYEFERIMEFLVSGCASEEGRTRVSRTVVVDGEIALVLGVSGKRE